MPESAVSLPESLLNSKEWHSCKANFIKFNALGKSVSLTYWSMHGLFAELLPVPVVWSLRI